jgi:cytochrome c oxidase cbb3-type subunit I/II
MLSLKNVNAIAHYTDWIIARSRRSACVERFYGIWYDLRLVPRMTKSNLYSQN